MGLQHESGCHIRRSTKIWLSFCIHRFLSSLVSALSQFLHITKACLIQELIFKADEFTLLIGSYFVTHSVSLHWLTRVSLSSSLCGLTVMSSKVLGRAQNSLFAGSTLRLVQLARLMRPIGFCRRKNLLIIMPCKKSILKNQNHYSRPTFRFSSSGQVQ